MLQDDLSAFFDPQHFAQAVVLGGKTIMGIFDDAVDVTSVGSLGMAGTRPVVTLPSADVPTQVVGQQLQVAGRHFEVAEADPDGTGCTKLWLEVIHA